MAQDYISPLYIASQNNQLEMVRALLRAGANVNEGISVNNVTPLIMASSKGHIEVVQILVEAGADVNLGTSSDNTTPLNMASSTGHIEVVQILVGAGADVNLGTSDDNCTPLYMASQHGHLEVVLILICAGADVNTTTYDGQNPLLMASSNGHLDVVKALIEAGANVNQVDMNNVTPLHAACQEGHHEIVQTLLRAYADVNIATSDGNVTPLYFASQMGHHKIVQNLLEANAVMNVATSYKKITPLYIATQLGHLKVVQTLLGAGADVDAKAYDGTTPMIVATTNGYIDILNELLAANAPVNAAKLQPDHYQIRAPPTVKRAPPLSSQLLVDEHCTELFKMTSKAADKWRAIGIFLGFNNDELDGLVREPGRYGDEDYYAAMLRKWLDWAPPNHPHPTIGALVAALYSAGKEILANELELIGIRKELFGGCGGVGDGGGCYGALPTYPQGATPYQDPSDDTYSTLVGSIQDADTLADRLYAKGVTAENIRENVEGCHTATEKNRVSIGAVQQQVDGNPGSFQTFIDVLKMDKSNQKLTGCSNGTPITDAGSDRRQNAGGGATGGDGGRKDDFKKVSGDQLGEDDLGDVVKEVIDVASRWKPLGLALMLNSEELDTISSKNHTDPTEYLIDMLLAWLQQHYDIKKYGSPSWRMLCQAIAKAVGGNNPALATELHTS